jgi:hypothetical protein
MGTKLLSTIEMNFSVEGSAVAQVVSGRPLTGSTWVQTQAKSCEMYEVPSDNDGGFSPRIPIVPGIIITPMLHKLSN